MKRHTILILLSAFIVIPALFFPYHVHIANVLTGQAAKQFSVDISPWRVVFEPLFGPMLFALRADQPLVEMAVALLWALAGMFVITIIKLQRQKSGVLSVSGSGFLRWLGRAPILIVLWLALLTVIIFAPLPNNSIINNDADALLLNTHSHTEWSHDGLISGEKLMRWHERNGFDAFFITDHNNHGKTLEFVAKQKAGKVPPRPLVLVGEEFSGSNHIALLGLQRDFKTKGMPDSTAIDSAQANGGVAIVAHWFADQHKSIQHYIDIGADGFEIVNQAEGLQYDRRIFDDIVRRCRDNGLLMTAACDYHGYGSAALAWNALSSPGHRSMDAEEKRRAIMNVLRDHQQDKIKVLMYRDRPLFPRRLVAWSPIFNTINYFRSLNSRQVLSWLLWLVGLYFIVRLQVFKQWMQHLQKAPVRFFGVAGAAASSFILGKGLHLLSKAPHVHGYNDIYVEYGDMFLRIGVIFFLYSLLFAAQPVLKNRWDKILKRKQVW